MKNIKLFIAVFLAIGAASCQKVIDVKLNSTAPQYVIEGEVNDGPGPYQVTISRTKDFSADNNFEKVSGAQVTIADQTTGVSETLAENASGSYFTSSISGVPGHTYQLHVVINSQTYDAVSTMPSQKVTLDTIYASRSEFGDDHYYITPEFKDPAGKGNYYLLRQWVNGQLIKGTAARSDEALDGQTYRFQFRYDTDADAGNPEIHNGDSITCQLQCVNKQVYDYYRTLREVTGASNSATPTNPLTNISGGALGIFNTCISNQKSAVAVF